MRTHSDISHILKKIPNIDSASFEEQSSEVEYMNSCYSEDERGNISHLAIFDIKGINLESITKYKHLKYLIIRYCDISIIPESISNLENLENLDLSCNLITKIPNSIEKLESLHILTINNNNLTELPFNFGKIPNLVWCFLEENKITHLPDSICDLGNLDTLNLNNNRLETLPDNFGRLNSLVELYLDSNRLVTLPHSMSHMESIDSLRLDFNKFPFDTREFRDMSSIDLINFIIQSTESVTDLLNEFKLLVVGDERVGKTSIINRVLDRKFDENCESTMGVDIINGFTIGDYKVNIWDFAGQEITHQTHQFFLSKRSLYFLVIDSQVEDDSQSIYNWLSIIKTYGGPESPVIIIVNKNDVNCSYTFDTELYEQDFNIVDVIYSSAKNNVFLNYNKSHQVDIKERIKDSIKHLKGLDFRIPSNWLKIKVHIENESYKKKNIMEMNEFESLCTEYNIDKANEQSSLLSLLNKIGTIVAYEDDERLNIIQIIKPTWITNAVYLIIRSEHIDSNGKLNYKTMKDIFVSSSIYKKHHFRWLMDLLLQFKLAFEVQGNELLIPSRILKSQPKFDLNIYSNGFGYKFDYHTFLKRNILSQLIVRLHQSIDNETPKYWKRGVFFKNSMAKAVVILDEFQKTIEIRTSDRSPSSVELRGKIVDTIREINDGNFDVDEYISIRNINGESDYESYEFLVDLLEKGRSENISRVRDKTSRKLISYSYQIKEVMYGINDSDYHNFDFKTLNLNLISSLLLMTESRSVIINEKENLINIRVRDALLNRGYFAADQSLGGESESMISEGERDLVLRCEDGHSKTIIEGMCLSIIDKSKIDIHYNKLRNNYDTCGHKYNYLVVYSKSSNFSGFCNRYLSFFRKKGTCIEHSDLSQDSRNLKVFETRIDNTPVMHILVSFAMSILEK